eukprot:1465503-Pleurochrysis_carterae.AAC.1
MANMCTSVCTKGQQRKLAQANLSLHESPHTSADQSAPSQCRCFEPLLLPRNRGRDSHRSGKAAVSYTHLRAHETDSYL